MCVIGAVSNTCRVTERTLEKEDVVRRETIESVFKLLVMSCSCSAEPSHLPYTTAEGGAGIASKAVSGSRKREPGSTFAIGGRWSRKKAQEANMARATSTALIRT